MTQPQAMNAAELARYADAVGFELDRQIAGQDATRGTADLNALVTGLELFIGAATPPPGRPRRADAFSKVAAQRRNDAPWERLVLRLHSYHARLRRVVAASVTPTHDELLLLRALIGRLAARLDALDAMIPMRARTDGLLVTGRTARV